MSKEAMKLALEGAANYIDALGGDSRKYRHALAEQPAQQEPVDGATLAGLYASISILSHLVDHQRQLLVEVEDVFGRDGHYGKFEDGEFPLIDRVRAQIESIVPQPAQQEPVACAQIVSLNDMQGVVDWLPHNGAHLKAGDYLYTSPPASKPWVGLTIREIEWCFEDASGENIVAARNIEAKLREKNNG